MSAKKRAREIKLKRALFIVMLLLPPLWIVFLIWLTKNNDKTQKAINERDRLTAEFATKNSFIFKGRIELFAELVDVNKMKKLWQKGQSPSTLNTAFDLSKIRHSEELPYVIQKQNSSELVSKGTIGRELTGTIANLNFTYQYSMLGGENQLILLTVDLPIVLSRVFIDSKQNNLPGLDKKVNNFTAIQSHSLEGDFPNYYNVYLEENKQIDMLTILTPEVMDILKTNNLFDVWLNGNKLMLITFGSEARYFAGLPSALESAKVLIYEIDQIARAIRKLKA